MTTTIVLGVQQKSPPQIYHDIPTNEARRILRRVEDLGAKCYARGVDMEDDIFSHLRNKGISEIEIFGLWEDLCVSAAIARAIKEGISVRVPKGYTLRSWLPNYHGLRANVAMCLSNPFVYKEDEEYRYFVATKNSAP